MMRQALWSKAFFAVGVFLLPASKSAAAAQAVAQNIDTAWDAKRDGDPKSYTVGDLQLTLASSNPAVSSVAPAPVMTVVSPRFGRAVLVGQGWFFESSAHFSVLKIDPKADGPAVILTSYSGGAHCCTGTLILDPIDGRWRTIDGGAWNDGPALPPKDLDGDGTPDFLLEDENFLYAFACYACGPAPPRIVDVIGGVWTDVSKSPRFARVYEKDADRVKSGCAAGGVFGESGGQNGLCAAYVADEARLGRFKQAWAFMLVHYDRKDTWGWPTGCRAPDAPCSKGGEVVYKTYPEALRAFLVKHDYISANQAAAAPIEPLG